MTQNGYSCVGSEGEVQVKVWHQISVCEDLIKFAIQFTGRRKTTDNTSTVRDGNRGLCTFTTW